MIPLRSIRSGLRGDGIKQEERRTLMLTLSSKYGITKAAETRTFTAQMLPESSNVMAEFRKVLRH
jgi:hypothetical protein